MPIIKNRELIEERWRLLADDTPPPPGGQVLVSLTRYLAAREALAPLAAAGRLGVACAPTDDVNALEGALDDLALITIRFPHFKDGRGYSQASILRSLGYDGDLRAVGDVLPDQVFFMRRCGFNELDVREPRLVDAALAALDRFSNVYQDAVDTRPVVAQQRALKRAQV